MYLGAAWRLREILCNEIDFMAQGLRDRHKARINLIKEQVTRMEDTTQRCKVLPQATDVVERLHEHQKGLKELDEADVRGDFRIVPPSMYSEPPKD